MEEYRRYSGLKFEIQVRTILQHAWANLTHDRHYKLNHTLPVSIERKINLYSGLLEVVDNGFSEIINDISEYTKKINDEKEDVLDDLVIDSINLPKYVRELIESNSLNIGDDGTEDLSFVIDELRLYNVNKLKDIKSILPKDFFENLSAINEPLKSLGILRLIMIVNDYKKLACNPNRSWVFGNLPSDDPIKEFLLNYLTKEQLEEFVNLTNKVINL